MIGAFSGAQMRDMTRHQSTPWLYACLADWRRTREGLTRPCVARMMAVIRLELLRRDRAVRAPFVDISHVTDAHGVTGRLSAAVRVF